MGIDLENLTQKLFERATYPENSPNEDFPLKKMGLDVSEATLKGLINLDPDKIYVMITDENVNKENIFEIISELSPYFKNGKGELLLLNKKVGVREFTLNDMKIIRDKIDQLISAVEKKNKILKDRYQLLRDEDECV